MTDIDECSDNPCQNNATCTDLINKYQCQCADGFNGTNCDISKDQIKSRDGCWIGGAGGGGGVALVVIVEIMH